MEYFTRWEPWMDQWKKKDPTFRGMEPNAVIQEMVARLEHHHGEDAAKDFLCHTNIGILQVEHMWNMFGRPYYKVWPGIIDALCKTNLNFDSTHLRFPYPASEVCFGGCDCGNWKFGTTGTALVSFTDYRNSPSEQDIKLLDISDEQKLGLLYGRAIQNQQAKDARIRRGKDMFGVLHIVYGMPEDDEMTRTETCVALYKDSTLEDDLEFNHSVQRPELKSGQRYLSDDEQSNLARVVVGVMMFGVHNHEMVLPDIETPVIVGRGKKKKALERQAIHKAVKECKGWLVGSEIDLPQPEIVGSTNERPGCGTPLKFGHVRSGHMRLQPCGPQRKDRKLIFVEPTVVRSDLPVRQSHGYRIKDTLLTGGAR